MPRQSTGDPVDDFVEELRAVLGGSARTRILAFEMRLREVYGGRRLYVRQVPRRVMVLPDRPGGASNC